MPNTSAPLTSGTVTCSCQVGTAPINGSGNYSFPNIAPGNYSLTFSDTGYVTLVINNVAVVAGTTTTTNAALTEDGSITGNVTDATASGNPPLSGVTVTCSCQVATATTDGSGNYTFLNIAPGTYSLTFALSGYVTSTINNVSVISGSPTNENIALTQDGGFNGTVTDSNSNPLQGVTVSCNGCGVSSATTSADGTYSFTNIAPGTYSLTFSDTGYVTQTISGQVVNAGASTEVDATMITDGGIQGTVTDLQTSLPIMGALVTCSACPTTTSTTDGSGHYSFTLVPNGTYTLVVTASGYVNRTVSGVVVTGPSTTTRNPMLDEEGGISGTVTDAQTTHRAPGSDRHLRGLSHDHGHNRQLGQLRVHARPERVRVHRHLRLDRVCHGHHHRRDRYGTGEHDGEPGIERGRRSHRNGDQLGHARRDRECIGDVHVSGSGHHDQQLGCVHIHADRPGVVHGHRHRDRLHRTDEPSVLGQRRRNHHTELPARVHRQAARRCPVVRQGGHDRRHDAHGNDRDGDDARRPPRGHGQGPQHSPDQRHRDKRTRRD